jgi:hypothetical protein
MQFANNEANVQTYKAGQTVHFDVKIMVRHTGTANMSIVDMKSNKIVKQLLHWDQYADEKQKTLPANNTAFDVTIPSDLKGACATAGDCVYHFPFRKMTRWIWLMLGRSVNCGGMELASSRLMSRVCTSRLLHPWRQ